MTTTWRLNIKTGAEEGVDPRMFCIDRNILGIGWRVPVNPDTPLGWDAYQDLGMEEYYLKRDCEDIVGIYLQEKHVSMIGLMKPLRCGDFRVSDGCVFRVFDPPFQASFWVLLEEAAG